MMRFPLRLSAYLAKARFAPGIRPIQFVDAAEVLHHDSNHPVSHEKIREMNASRSPVVWIGGSEPLHHPGISHLVRAITQTGHFVFLETNGDLLRRRIHEFQPMPRLLLTVRLESGAQRGVPKSFRAAASDLAVEGIRAARLSGFLICTHLRVQAQAEVAEMAELVQSAQALDVDGIVISPATRGSNSSIPAAAAVQEKTEEVRKLIGSKWWRYFSRLVEPVLAGEPSGAGKAERDTDLEREEESHAKEEGIRVA